jgi:hypothetical protein
MIGRKILIVTFAIGPVVALACGNTVELSPVAADSGIDRADGDMTAPVDGEIPDSAIIETSAADAPIPVPLLQPAGQVYATSQPNVEAMAVSSQGYVAWTNGNAVLACTDGSLCNGITPKTVYMGIAHGVAATDTRLFWSDDTVGVRWTTFGDNSGAVYDIGVKLKHGVLATDSTNLYAIKLGSPTILECPLDQLTPDAGPTPCSLDDLKGNATALAASNGSAFVALDNGSIVRYTKPTAIQTIKDATADPKPASAVALSLDGSVLFWGYRDSATLASIPINAGGPGMPHYVSIDGLPTLLAGRTTDSVFWATSSSLGLANVNPNSIAAAGGLAITAFAMNNAYLWYADSKTNTILRRSVN